MRRGEVIVLVFIVLLFVGMVFSSLYRTRYIAAKMEWKNRLREISLGLHNDSGPSTKGASVGNPWKYEEKR
jgi:hypothetical protein